MTVLLADQSAGADHLVAIVGALGTLSTNPDLVRWHYIRAAYEACGRNVRATAKQLGMHRRTLQRILASNPPAERWLA